MFSLTQSAIEINQCRQYLQHSHCGGYVSFEGWVRQYNAGLKVSHLYYEAHHTLAIKEGQRIITDAKEKFAIQEAFCIHRLGDLIIGDIAVWIGVSAPHRDAAFKACQYIIDHIKHSVPIWKKEYYEDKSDTWVNCENCKNLNSPLMT